MLPRYPGTHFSDELSTTFRIVVTDTTIEIRRPNAPPIPLRAAGEHQFVGPAQLTVTFLPHAAGRVPSFEIAVGRLDGIWFVRQDGEG